MSINVYLTYSNSICLLILACHCAFVGGHLVASFQTAPLLTCGNLIVDLRLRLGAPTRPRR